MSDKVHLQWNEFQSNVNVAFGNLKEDTDFADVTLACEDGEQFEAHKVILAASSSFFQNLLRRNKDQKHPLVFMRGVTSENMAAIVDFIYTGEASVPEENHSLLSHFFTLLSLSNFHSFTILLIHTFTL